jgi:hypothetical protein
MKAFAIITAVAATLQLAPAKADVLTYIYTYTGLPFTNFSGTISLYPSNVTAYFSYNGNANALNGTFPMTEDPFDPLPVLIDVEGTCYISIYSSCGGSVTFKNGVVTGWSLGEIDGSRFGSAWYSTDSTAGDSFTTSYIDLNTGYGFYGSASNTTPGTWTVTPSLAPLPAALPMLAAGLAGIGWLTRRRLAA